MGRLLVLGPILLHSSQQVLTERITLLGRLLQPKLSVVQISRNTASRVVAAPQVPLCEPVSLFGRLSVPGHRIADVAASIGSCFQHVAHCELGGSIAKIGGSANIIDPAEIASR